MPTPVALNDLVRVTAQNATGRPAAVWVLKDVWPARLFERTSEPRLGVALAGKVWHRQPPLKQSSVPRHNSIRSHDQVCRLLLPLTHHMRLAEKFCKSGGFSETNGLWLLPVHQ
jgi:hypothetical protein